MQKFAFVLVNLPVDETDVSRSQAFMA
jgi:hypothetical protein